MLVIVCADSVTRALLRHPPSMSMKIGTLFFLLGAPRCYGYFSVVLGILYLTLSSRTGRVSALRHTPTAGPKGEFASVMQNRAARVRPVLTNARFGALK